MEVILVIATDLKWESFDLISLQTIRKKMCVFGFNCI